MVVTENNMLSFLLSAFQHLCTSPWPYSASTLPNYLIPSLTVPLVSAWPPFCNQCPQILKSEKYISERGM